MTWQEVPVWMLQWPGMGEVQLALDVHDVPVCTVQWPATVGQLALDVHDVPVCTVQ